MPAAGCSSHVIRLDIDIKNILTLFRLRADNLAEDAKEMYILGGTMSAADFAAWNTIRTPGIRRPAQDEGPRRAGH